MQPSIALQIPISSQVIGIIASGLCGGSSDPTSALALALGRAGRENGRPLPREDTHSQVLCSLSNEIRHIDARIWLARIQR